jgi:hypothetical protein
MDYRTESSFRTILLLALVVLVGIGVWELFQPEREAQQKLRQLIDQRETKATLKLTVELDLENERIHIKEQTIEWKHAELTAMREAAEEERESKRARIEELDTAVRAELTQRLGREPNDQEFIKGLLQRAKD